MPRLAVFAASLVLAGAAPAAAQEGGAGWLPSFREPYIAGNLGGDAASDNTDDRTTLSAHTGVDANLRVGVQSYPWLRSELGVTYLWLPVNEASVPTLRGGTSSTNAEGRLTGTALTTGFYYDAARDRRFSPVLGFRLGAGRAAAQIDAGSQLSLDKSGYALAWGFTGGASYAVFEDVRAELLYQSLHTWQRQFETDAGTGYEVALHAHSVTLGLRYSL